VLEQAGESYENALKILHMVSRYPDITHNVRCQYPVPDWDGAFAQLISRECTNPRPAGTAHIHNLFAPLAEGFVSYSDGCHDDVNKMIWTALGWEPDADVEAIVRDYARVFFGEAYAEDVAKGLWMLESNWDGAVLENQGINATLAHWQALEQRAGDDLARNWRFQLYLLRAICDGYIRARLVAETAQEQEILEALEGIRGPAIGEAAAALHAKLSETPPPEVRGAPPPAPPPPRRILRRTPNVGLSSIPSTCPSTTGCGS